MTKLKTRFLLIGGALSCLLVPSISLSCTANSEKTAAEKEFETVLKNFNESNVKFLPNSGKQQFNPILSIAKPILLEDNDFIDINTDNSSVEISATKSYIKNNKFWVDFSFKTFDAEIDSLLKASKSLSFDIWNGENKNTDQDYKFATTLYNVGKNKKQIPVSYYGINPEIWNIFVENQNLFNMENSQLKRLPTINIKEIKDKSVMESYNDSKVISRSETIYVENFSNYNSYVLRTESADFSENDSRIGIFEMSLEPITSDNSKVKTIISEHDSDKKNLIKYADLLKNKYYIQTEAIFNYAKESDIETHKTKNRDIGLEIQNNANIDNPWLRPFLLINKDMYFKDKDKKPTLDDVINWNTKSSIFGAPIWFDKTYKNRDISFSISDVVSNDDSENVKITIKINIGKNEFMDSSNEYIRYFNINTCLFYVNPFLVNAPKPEVDSDTSNQSQ